MSQTAGTPEKPRSCVTCAKRKVRCDKQYPCSRCQRAGISCVLPSIDHRPRYARHHVQSAVNDAGTLSTQSTSAGTAVDKIVDRLKFLERLVQDLSGELEQARGLSTAVTSKPGSRIPEVSSAHVADAGATIPQAGRLVLDDSNCVRYVSSGFWSRIDCEIDSLKEDVRSHEKDDIEVPSEEHQPQSKSSSTAAEADRTPLDRHAFLLKHSVSSASYDTLGLYPMVSQIPFILEVFSERVHSVIGLPHMPSLRRLLQYRRNGRVESSSPEEEALAFSVFYAAICSLDDDEVTESFNVSKNELTLKYRVGLEHALAKADFLNNPSILLIQAFLIFLALARRHDSPKFVWMMTGLVLRMAHYLGIHHDGSGSKHITPFQVEIHRRIWWNLCALDARATEDQGTDLAILHGSYSTKIPTNINDSDIWPEIEQLPLEREELTDVAFLRLCSKITRHIQEMVAAGVTATVHDHYRRLSNLMQELENDYFNRADRSRDHGYLAAMGWMRIALGRLSLLSFFPMLYSSPSMNLSTDIRTKLLVAAIDVAEHNHALNSDASCQPWKWVYQTQQHWHAVVYLLIEICRRPWSPTIERAWVALQSPWLVPIRARVDKNFNVWVPLRNLMARARKHRENEIVRLQTDPDAAARIEREDQQQIPVPSSSTTFPTYFNHEMFHKRWRQLIRPVAAIAMDTLNGAGSTARDNHNRTSLDSHFSSSIDTSNINEMAPLVHNNQVAFASTLGGSASSSASAPWSRDSMDFADCGNLDTFLGTDTAMELDVVLNDGDTLNFDWNSWFESNKGVL